LVKYWEIIADNLSKAGWSWGCVSAIDSSGQTIWIVDAHRGDGKRYVVHAASVSRFRRRHVLRGVLESNDDVTLKWLQFSCNSTLYEG